MSKIIIDDGFNPEFVSTAMFDGILEMPVIECPTKFIIPELLVPFTARRRAKRDSSFVVFYEHDELFGGVLKNPDKYVNEFTQFRGVCSLDDSVYVDSPLIVQMANVYRTRAIGHFMQKNGIYTIPNVRWGDERSYTSEVLPEKFAFLGLPKHSIYSIGTFGCCQTSEERYHFRCGLIAMIDELSPEIVLVYGPMPDSIFHGLTDKAQFVAFPDWTTYVKGGAKNGNQ